MPALPAPPALPSHRLSRGVPGRPSWRRGRVRGVALVETLTALAITGTVAAAALPHLASLESIARSTGLRSIASAASRAMAHNLAGCLITEGRATPGHCQPVSDCAQVQLLLLGGVPEGHTVPAQPIIGSGAIGQPETVCTLRHDASGQVAAFIGLATPR